MRNLFSLLMVFLSISLFAINPNPSYMNNLSKKFVAVKGWTHYVMQVSSAKSYAFIAEKKYQKDKAVMILSVMKGGPFVTAMQRGAEQFPTLKYKGFPVNLQKQTKTKGRIVVSLGLSNNHSSILALDYIESSQTEALAFIKKFDWKAILTALTVKD